MNTLSFKIIHLLVGVLSWVLTGTVAHTVLALGVTRGYMFFASLIMTGLICFGWGVFKWGVRSLHTVTFVPMYTTDRSIELAVTGFGVVGYALISALSEASGGAL